MVIQHNMTAANANRQLGIVTNRLAKSTEKLSSGYKINRAADDAAGLSISEKMRAQIRGLHKASQNAQDGISLIQTAEGALAETEDILQRMRELAVQAANDTNQAEDRKAIQAEINQLVDEIDRIAKNTQFNKKNLLDGTFDGTLQVGANYTSGDTNSSDNTMKIKIGDMKAATLLSGATIKVDNLDTLAIEDIEDSTGGVLTYTSANSAINTIETAIQTVSTERSKLGAYQNRLEHTISNLNNTAENLQSAESRIRDVDMAEEMVNYSKDMILQQAAQAMLAQANQQSQGVLSLLK